MTRIFSDQELIERLADKEHASWARWMAYLFSKCRNSVERAGDVVIPAGLVQAWKRQIEAPYAELGEREKQMDRDEVAHILPIIRDARIAELCHAMLIVESCGASPELTDAINKLGNRMHELESD